MKYALTIVAILAFAYYITMNSMLGELPLDQYLTGTQIIESFATWIAIIIGGWWTYDRFVSERHIYPRLETTHDVSAVPLGPSKTLVRVMLRVQNTGRPVLKCDNVLIRLQQIAPCEHLEWIEEQLDDPSFENGEGPFPVLGERELRLDDMEIEPGEPDCFVADFIVSATVSCVSVYSHLANPRKVGREIGWNQHSVHRINGADYDTKPQPETESSGTAVA